MRSIVQITLTAIVLLLALWLSLWQADSTIKIHHQQMIDTAIRSQRVAMVRDKLDSLLSSQSRIERKLDSLLGAK